ncbi:MAG: arylsulfatase A-like enzyme [Rhodothermales bacterium]|jgi:arylsulfatase A-like enzyme
MYHPARLALFAAFITVAIHAKKTNIVFVMADDLAWADVGFNGAKFYETPNIDALAADGMRFNQAYSGGPNCLPTRACLISGMYTPRYQIWTPGGKSKGDKNKMRLNVPGASDSSDFPSKLSLEPSVTSIAEVLSKAGYKTARFGKWHVGPDTQGFDISDSSGKGNGPDGKFYGNINVHEWLTDAGVKFIGDNKGQPFFLYLSHWDVHTPIRARPEVKAKYTKKLKDGDWDRQWNTTYAAMIEAVDKSVGRLRATLKEMKLDENTVFIFTSDNGGHAGATTNKPLLGAKGALFEGGIRVPTCITWPKTIQAKSVTQTPITSVDFMPTFAELSGAPLPTNQPVDGKSIVPLLKGNTLADRAIFWHYPLYLAGSGEGKVVSSFGTQDKAWRGVPSSVIRKGPYKLIHYFEDDSVALFNIDADRSESQDLAKKQPELAATLLAELSSWQKDVKAPIPSEINPNFGKPASKSKGKKKAKKNE